MLEINIIIVIILLGGWISGRLFSAFKLPGVLGMTLFGVAISYFFKSAIPDSLWQLAPLLKSIALLIILLRAGLGLSRKTLNSVGLGSILMGFIPCLIEASVITLIAHYFLSFPLLVSGMLGFLLAAVSPAVVVPSMLKLKEEGIGKSVPTMILAGASLDDVFTISIFTVLLQGYGQGGFDLMTLIYKIPLSLILGILPGLLLGFLFIWLLPRLHEKLRATEKVLILITAAMLLTQFGETAHVASLLGIITIGFILLEYSPGIAQELAAKLNKAWVFAEIFLFVLIGMAVDVDIALEAGGQGIVVIGIGLLARSIGVLIACMGTTLKWKERVFCIIAYIPKATVQAAFGAAALGAGVPQGGMILAIAVLSIIITAPLGLIGINLFGKKLLESEEI